MNIRIGSVIKAKLHWENKEIGQVTVIGFWSPTGPFVDVRDQFDAVHCIRREDITIVETY